MRRTRGAGGSEGGRRASDRRQDTMGDSARGEARGLHLPLEAPERTGGQDSGLGTCSPTSDRGLPWGRPERQGGQPESPAWLDALVERLQTVFVTRQKEGGARRRRRTGSRRRRDRRHSKDKLEEDEEKNTSSTKPTEKEVQANQTVQSQNIDGDKNSSSASSGDWRQRKKAMNNFHGNIEIIGNKKASQFSEVPKAVPQQSRNGQSRPGSFKPRHGSASQKQVTDKKPSQACLNQKKRKFDEKENTGQKNMHNLQESINKKTSNTQAITRKSEERISIPEQGRGSQERSLQGRMVGSRGQRRNSENLTRGSQEQTKHNLDRRQGSKEQSLTSLDVLRVRNESRRSTERRRSSLVAVQEYVRTRRDSGSPMWWEGLDRPDLGEKSKYAPGVNSVLVRRASLSSQGNDGENNVSPVDLSRRYSYFLDFIEDMCSGAGVQLVRREEGVEGVQASPTRRHGRRPSQPACWGEVKHQLTHSSELLLSPEQWCTEPVVALQCRAHFPTLGLTSFLLLHSCPPQGTGLPGHCQGRWYRFLKL